jgi:hypothetical protein
MDGEDAGETPGSAGGTPTLPWAEGVDEGRSLSELERRTGEVMLGRLAAVRVWRHHWRLWERSSGHAEVRPRSGWVAEEKAMMT